MSTKIASNNPVDDYWDPLIREENPNWPGLANSNTPDGYLGFTIPRSVTKGTGATGDPNLNSILHRCSVCGDAPSFSSDRLRMVKLPHGNLYSICNGCGDFQIKDKYPIIKKSLFRGGTHPKNSIETTIPFKERVQSAVQRILDM